MGSITYDFLADSILFNGKEIDSLYASLSDDQLDNILNDYRNHCISNLTALTNEVSSNKSSLKVLSSIEEMPYDMLKQGALYFDQFVIYDPLFKHTHIPSSSSEIMTQFMGFNGKSSVRKKLADTIKLLKALTPMIAADYVKVLPLSKGFEPPKEIPIILPTNSFQDILSPEIIDFFRERAVVKSMKKHNEGGWVTLNEQALTSGIFVTFEGLPPFTGRMYHYMEQEFLRQKEDNKLVVRFNQVENVEKTVWDAWVNQSINQAAISIYDKVYYESSIASYFNATYLTDNSFTSDLLTTKHSSLKNIQTDSATQFMNLTLPFIDNINIEKLMDVRNYDNDTFTNFRIELERQFRELRGVTDPYEIKLRQENILHELGSVQVDKINKQVKSLQRLGLIEGTILLAGLAGTIQTGGSSLLATTAIAGAAAAGYKTFTEYKSTLTENASFLLWKVLGK